MDNASNNDTLVSELSILLPNFKGARVRVRCFAHVLNLVIKVCRTTGYPIGLMVETMSTGDPLSVQLSKEETDCSR